MAADINIRIGAKLDGLQRSIKKAQRSLTGFADFAERVGTDLTTRLSVPVLGVGTAAVTAFAKFERLENGLKAIAEEGEDAGETLERLQKIAQLPGISLEQAVKGSNQLRNVGFEAQQAEAILTQLSKAVTLSGEGPQQLEAVVRQLVQMSAKGRILQEDLGVIQENVPSIGIAIQDAFGTQNIEAIRATGVSAQEFTARITKAISENEKFQKVQGGLANEFDNFRQSVQISLAALGKSIAQSINLSGILQRLSKGLSAVTERFQSLSPRSQKFIVITAGIAAAIGPVLLGFGAFVKIATGVQAALLLVSGGARILGGALLSLVANPIGAAIAGLVAVSAAIYTAYKRSETFRATIAGVGAVIKKFASDAVRFLRLPFDTIRDLFSGDIEGAIKRASGIFKNEGETAGEAFARAYNASLQKNVQSEIAGRQTGSRGRLGASSVEVTPKAPNLDQVFANLPNVAPQLSETAQKAEEVAINYERIARVTPNLAPQGLTNINGEFVRSLESVGAAARVNATNLTGYTSFIGQYLSQIDLAAEKNRVFGDSQAFLSEKINITRQALEQAVEQFGANSVEVEELKSRYTALNEELANVEEQQNRIGLFTGIISSIGDEVESLAERGKLSFKSFANAALSAISDVIGGLIKQGVAAAVANALKNPAGIIPPVGIALAAAAGAGASALFKGLINTIKPPGLAGGGIIPPGFEGDRFPAFLNSGEAVIPLDRLFREINGGGGQIQGIVRGQDLLIMMERAASNRSRLTGV